MRRIAVVVLAVVLSIAVPNPGRAQTVEAVANAVTELAKLTKFLIERYDSAQREAVANAVPNIVKEFVLLSSEKEALANLLDKIAPNTTDQRLAYDIEAKSATIVRALKRIETDIGKIDPHWVEHNPELAKATKDLRLEKVQVIDGVLRSGGVTKLSRDQIAAYSKALRTEAGKLIPLAKQLASATS